MTLYQEALQADDALQAGLIAHYGARKAPDARYKPIWEHPEWIQELVKEKQRLDVEWLEVLRSAK